MSKSTASSSSELQPLTEAAVHEAETCFVPGQNQAQLGEIVPPTYDRYCRVLHPPSIPDEDGNLKPTSWGALARAIGRDLDPSTHGSDLVSSYRQTVGKVEEPYLGSYTATVEVDELIEYQLRIGSLAEALRDSDQELHIGFSDLTDRPFKDLTLRLGHFGSRRFHCAVLADGGEMDALLDVFTGVIWPNDLSWWITTDIDLDFTLVGGSAHKVAETLKDHRFEALPLTATG